MELRFDAEAVLVTGASSGIGAAVAEGFGAAGATVGVHFGHDRAGAERTAARVEAVGGKAVVLEADLATPAGRARLVEETLSALGTPRVLVNNAGSLVRRSPVEETDDELFTKIFELNFRSVFELCRAFVPAMRAAGGGAIVNISSISARTGGAGGSVLYGSAKAALSTFTRGLAVELAPSGIRVNALAPGLIDTPFHEQGTPPERFAAIAAGIPMGRPGTPEECVGPVLFFAHPLAASYVTGQCLEVNGGQLTP